MAPARPRATSVRIRWTSGVLARAVGIFAGLVFAGALETLRVVLPPLGNEFVTLLKDSSLVSVLAVSELTRRGREYVARSFLSFDTFTMVALIYLLMTLFFTRLFAMIERRLAVEKR